MEGKGWDGGRKKPRTYREPSFYPIREVVVKGGSFRFGKVGVKKGRIGQSMAGKGRILNG
jgi:hypothetical protein